MVTYKLLRIFYLPPNFSIINLFFGIKKLVNMFSTTMIDELILTINHIQINFHSKNKNKYFVKHKINDTRNTCIHIVL